jgi:hypothetical protein
MRATTSTATPPQPVVTACLLVVFVLATAIAGPLLPSSEGNIVFGTVACLVTAVAAAGLWSLRRWGFIATVVVSALTFLSDAPAIAVGSTGLIKVWAALSVVACGLIILLVTRPDARRAYR